MEKIKDTAQTLETKGFKCHIAENKAAANTIALQLISENSTVGIPGTMTVREIGLYAALKARGNKIYDHWESKAEITNACANWLDENTSDWFVTSANAISAEDGAIINIDGTGNRVAAISWAPGKLLFIVGRNKIADNFTAAMQRARDIASVKNAARFDIKTPCKTTGKCMKCNSPDKICNVITILEHVQKGREVHIILVNEELGF